MISENNKPWWPRWGRNAATHCALAMASGLLASPAHAGPSTIIWEGNDQSVVLAQQDEKTAPPNDHPATMAPQDIERMLANLRFRHADQEADAPPVAVFDKKQVEILGQALATGLTRADPSQDVVFSIIGAQRLSQGAFVRRNRLTSGRAFFRQGKLNVIFGEIQSPYRKKNIYGRVDEDFYPREYGSRAGPEKQESVLVASAGAGLWRDPSGTRNDWVVLDPAIGAEPSHAASAAAAIDPQSAGTAGRRKETAEPTEAGDADDIAQRLRTLKDLREQGLISEDAYRKRVDEILAEL